MENAQLNLNMKKSAEALVLSLKKAGVQAIPAMDVGFALDVSGSYEDEHKDGSTQKLLNRLIPWAMVFDPDKKADVMTFSGGKYNVVNVGPVTPDTCHNLIRGKVIGGKGWGGSTDYSYVLNAFFELFGWTPVAPAPAVAPTQAASVVPAPQKKKGFWAKLFGSAEDPVAVVPAVAPPAPVEAPTDVEETHAAQPSIIFVNTDGENYDKAQTRAVLEKAAAEHYGAFVFFIGVSNQNPDYTFLESLNAELPNVSFVNAGILQEFIEQTDEELNKVLLTPKLLNWIKASV